MKDDDEQRDDDEIDETGADGEERAAKDELFEAIDHFKNAASILFNKATKDPTVKSATKEAERIAKKIGDAAEPLAKQLTGELSRLTKDVLDVVEGGTKSKKGAKKKASRPEPPPSDEEE